MRKFRGRLGMFVLVLVLAFVGVSISPVSGKCGKAEAAAIKLSKTNLKLAVKESAALKIVGTKKKVQWSSSNKSVASVKNGKVTAKKKGTATITAKLGKSSYNCRVKVVDSKELYKTLLEKGNYKTKGYNFTINYFYLLDIDRDGISEMVCLDKWYDNSIYVFSIKGGKVIFLGGSGSRIGYNEVPKLYYSKKYKALCKIDKGATFGGGTMGMAYEYYRISGAKIKAWKYTAKMGVDAPSSYDYFMAGTSSAKAKYISKSKQNAFFKKYFAPKYIKSYKFLQNSANVRNRIWK